MDISIARRISRLTRLVTLAQKHNEARKKRGDQRGMMRAAELEMAAEAKFGTMLGVMSFNEFD